MKLLVVFVLGTFTLNGCKPGARQGAPASAIPRTLAAGDSATAARPGASWRVILRRDGSSDSVVGNIVLGLTITSATLDGIAGSSHA